MPGPFTLVVVGFELALLLAGLVLCWRLGLSPAARRNRPPAALAPWNVEPSEFLIFLLYAFAGTIAGSALTNLAGKFMGLTGPNFLVFTGSGGQVGLLAGAAFGLRKFRGAAALETAPPRQAPGVFASGVATFLISLPVLTAASLGWRALLRLVGLPEERQDLVDMFARAESPVVVSVLVILAVVVAPIAEELVFRAGIFRFMRTRVTRWLALVVPGMIFALLHMNFASFGPLVALAVIFSLAYERTGRIGTSIVAHALFNLNTIMLVFSGIDKLA
ncbi:MAG TPA: CPBP family intramembrane glutamic endopeptidase [Opitutaceae bacterium]|nr:CPBP family intramembrane glutamic endopeptidase [Opitutaceae bacterium]